MKARLEEMGFASKMADKIHPDFTIEKPFKKLDIFLDILQRCFPDYNFEKL